MKMQIIDISCSRRELELEQIRNYFIGNKYEVIEEDFIVDRNADIIIVSTCGFTQAAEDFALKTIKRVMKEKKVNCKVLIGGCLPKINPIVIQDFHLFDPQNYDKLDEYTKFAKKFQEFPRPNIIKEHRSHFLDREPGVKGLIKTIYDNNKFLKDISRKLSKKQYKIQCLQGCACNCSYCAIKFAIGKLKSKPRHDIINEFKIGVEKGYNKIFLEGDSLGCYGLDINTNIGELFDELIDVIKDIKVEISITDISPKYLDLCFEQIIKMANMKKIFNLYIPIQSGSQKILDLMKRGYEIEKTKNLIITIKNSCNNIKIGTSIIIGFPGETEEDLKNTIELCKMIKFDYIFCHCFSERKGTEAAKLPNKIASEEQLNRLRIFNKSLSR